MVCDALRVQYHRGPSYNPKWIWDCGGLMLGQDPVAVDSTGCNWIEERRRQAGLPSLAEEERDPKWLRTAARYGLGTADTKAIQVQEV